VIYRRVILCRQMIEASSPHPELGILLQALMALHTERSISLRNKILLMISSYDSLCQNDVSSKPIVSVGGSEVVVVVC
jgi:hypothetical protein